MGTASSKQEGPWSSHPLPPPATAPHSQAVLLDQLFGEEFLHTLVHAGTEPIPFLWQGWGNLVDTTWSGVKAECKCDFSPPPLSNGLPEATPGPGAGVTLGGC